MFPIDEATQQKLTASQTRKALFESYWPLEGELAWWGFDINHDLLLEGKEAHYYLGAWQSSTLHLQSGGDNQLSKVRNWHIAAELCGWPLMQWSSLFESMGEAMVHVAFDDLNEVVSEMGGLIPLNRDVCLVPDHDRFGTKILELEVLDGASIGASVSTDQDDRVPAGESVAVRGRARPCLAAADQRPIPRTGRMNPHCRKMATYRNMVRGVTMGAASAV